MGNLCDCQKEHETLSPKTPLLNGNTYHYNGHHKKVNPSPITVAPGHSARRFKPDNKAFETSLDQLSPVALVRVPNMPSMDKTFQDHAKLYNDLYANFTSLRQCLHDFKSKFSVETSGIPVMADCLRILAKRCGGATLTGSRSKSSIEIVYDRRQVSQLCQGPAEDVLETLELYNKANQCIKRILDKSSQVQSSIQLILDEEQKLKREVTKADPDGKLGPEPLRMTTENLIKLGKLPERIDTIQKYTRKTFDEICRSSRPLFAENDGK